MPIQGMTVNNPNSGDGLPPLGTIHKGEPKNNNRVGRDLPYFRVTFENQYRHLQLVWDEMYHEPTQLPDILIVGDTPDNAFPHYKEEWRKTGLLHRCDGTTQVRHFTDKGGYSNAHIPCAKTCGCVPVGRLSILIPEFYQATGVFGKFKLAVTSKTEITEIYALLSTLYQMAGTISRIHFTMGRHPRILNVEIDGKRMQKEYSLIYLVPNAYDIEDAVALRQGLILQGNNPNTPQLPPATITPDENGVTQDNINHWVYDDYTYNHLVGKLSEYELTVPMAEYLVGKPLTLFPTVQDFSQLFKLAWSQSKDPLSAFLVKLDDTEDTIAPLFSALPHFVNWWRKHSPEFLTPELSIEGIIGAIVTIKTQPTDNPFLNAQSDNKAVEDDERLESPELPLQSSNWGKSADMSDIPF